MLGQLGQLGKLVHQLRNSMPYIRPFIPTLYRWSTTRLEDDVACKHLTLKTGASIAGTQLAKGLIAGSFMAGSIAGTPVTGAAIAGALGSIIASLVIEDMLKKDKYVCLDANSKYLSRILDKSIEATVGLTVGVALTDFYHIPDKVDVKPILEVTFAKKGTKELIKILKAGDDEESALKKMNNLMRETGFSTALSIYAESLKIQ